MPALKTKPTDVDAPAPEPTQPAPPLSIYQAMPAIMRAVGFIEKSRQNPQQGYKFRGIDEVYEAVQLVLADHGVCVVPFVQAQAREERPTKTGGVLTYTILTVDHTFYAADGTHIVARTVGEAMDSGDKSSNKAMSAAMKYALIESLCIPTREPKDTEDDSPEPAARQPVQSASKMTTKQLTERPWFERDPKKMTRLQIAIAKLNLGAEEVQHRGLVGKDREAVERGMKCQYLCWAVGRDGLKSTRDLTDEEATKVIAKAEAGELPS